MSNRVASSAEASAESSSSFELSSLSVVFDREDDEDDDLSLAMSLFLLVPIVVMALVTGECSIVPVRLRPVSARVVPVESIRVPVEVTVVSSLLPLMILLQPVPVAARPVSVMLIVLRRLALLIWVSPRFPSIALFVPIHIAATAFDIVKPMLDRPCGSSALLRSIARARALSAVRIACDAARPVVAPCECENT